MKLKTGVILIIMMPFLYHHAVIHGQDQVKNARQTAVEAFTTGNYDQAYSSFRELLVTYPRDPLYKFYAGASLVELGRDPVAASDLLRQAVDAGSLKSLPPEALFYLGRAEQMMGNFDAAIQAYERYTGEAGRRVSREMNVQDYIQQSRNRQGRVQPETKVAQTPAASVVKPSSPSTTRDESLLSKTATELPAAESPQQKPAAVEKKPVQQKPVTAKIESNKVELEDMGKEASISRSQITGKQTGVFSVFEVLPEPVTDPRIQASINPEIPDGLIYRIQIAVFRNSVDLSFFKGLSPIYGFKAEGSTSTTYYAGMFRKAADAGKALSSVRSKGFRDSFVAALMDGKRVSADKAAVLEEEWGNKPLFSISSVKDPDVDTIPPTLVFSIEIARSKQPLTKEAVDAYVKTAGNRGLDVRQLEDGNFVYLIGNFITFESAEDYAALLVKNGYRDAKVTAWLGRREIDVKTARELFENLQ